MATMRPKEVDEPDRAQGGSFKQSLSECVCGVGKRLHFGGGHLTLSLSFNSHFSTSNFFSSSHSRSHLDGSAVGFNVDDVSHFHSLFLKTLIYAGVQLIGKIKGRRFVHQCLRISLSF